MTSLISHIVTLGGCSAALTLKRKLPQLGIRLIRSADISVIGVGEGTTPGFNPRLHG